jgi:hypothetical protein
MRELRQRDLAIEPVGDAFDISNETFFPSYPDVLTHDDVVSEDINCGVGDDHSKTPPPPFGRYAEKKRATCFLGQIDSNELETYHGEEIWSDDLHYLS